METKIKNKRHYYVALYHVTYIIKQFFLLITGFPTIIPSNSVSYYLSSKMKRPLFS